MLQTHLWILRWVRFLFLQCHRQDKPLPPRWDYLWNLKSLCLLLSLGKSLFNIPATLSLQAVFSITLIAARSESARPLKAYIHIMGNHVIYLTDRRKHIPAAVFFCVGNEAAPENIYIKAAIAPIPVPDIPVGYPSRTREFRQADSAYGCSSPSCSMAFHHAT